MKILDTVVAFVHDEKQRFLILKKQGFWIGWQFPKGEIDSGETEEQAVKRELKEETGINNINKITKLPFKNNYWYKFEGALTHINLTYFLIEVPH